MRPWLLAGCAVAWSALLASAVLVTRHPVVLSDEADYLLPTLFGYTAENYARWEILGQFPDVLFYRIYGLLRGTDIYVAAKILNAGFVAASAMPAYLLARRWLNGSQSAIFALLVVTAPIATLARCFMPEPLYYFGFWWCVHIALVRLAQPRFTAVLSIGAFVAALSLVKPHALAIVLALGLFLVLRPGGLAKKSTLALVLVGSWYASRLLFLYLLTGQVDASVAGPAYSSVLSMGRWDLPAVIVNFAGHLAALALLAGWPLVVLCRSLMQRHAMDGPARDLVLLAVCLLVTLVAMTVYFFHGVHILDPEVSPTRLNGRYYGFVIPLVLLAFFVASPRLRAPSPRRDDGAKFMAVAIVAWCIVAAFYDATWVDYPDLAILGRSRWGAFVLAVIAASCLLALRGFPTLRTRWRTLLPIMWWSGISVTTTAVVLLGPFAGGFAPTELDRAMSQDPVAIGLRHRDDGMILGPNDTSDASRVMFYLASMARGRLVPRDATVHGDAIPRDVDWLVVLPPVRYDGPGLRSMHGAFTYVRLH